MTGNSSLFKRFIILGALVLVSDILDLWSTYLVTPDLGKEWNPLVKDWGWTWTPVIILHGVLLILLLGAIFFHLRNEPLPSTRPKGLSGLGPRAAWYVFGYNAEKGNVQVRPYLAYLGLAIPLGAAVNALCNFTLHMLYHIGVFPGLNESSLLIYNSLKFTVILVAIIAVTLARIKSRYMKE